MKPLTPTGDPGGLAALVATLITAALIAIDPSQVMEGRWAPLIAAAVPIAGILAARLKAYAPATVRHEIAHAVAVARMQTLRGSNRPPGPRGDSSPGPAAPPRDIGPFTRPPVAPPPVVGPGHEGPVT